MERFGLVGLLVVCLPVLARAQRVEVSLFGGSYVPTGSVVQDNGDVCDDPCPPTMVPVSLKNGPMGGARISVHGRGAWGVDATVQHGRVPRQRVSGAYGTSEDVSATFFAIQPHVRFSLGGVWELAASAGPAASVLHVASASAGESRGGWRGGIAASASVRAYAAPLFVEISATSYSHHLTSNPAISDLHDFTLALGLGLVFKRDST